MLCWWVFFVSVCVGKQCLFTWQLGGWDAGVQRGREGRKKKEKKQYPSVTAILSPVLFCVLKEKHWKIKKYSEKALQNSGRISLSKLDWISSGYIFLFRKQTTPDIYIPEKLIMEGGKKGILWGPVGVGWTINMNSIKNKSEPLGKLTREITDIQDHTKISREDLLAFYLKLFSNSKWWSCHG